MEEPKADALWKHITALYDRMAEEQSEEGVWEGFTTRLQTELGIPVPYYGHVMDALKRMGCVDQLQRGGGTSPSRWALFKTPTLEEYVKVKPQLKSRPRGNRDDALEQRVSDIEARLQGIDVAQAIADLQLQINMLKGDESAA